MPTPGDIILYKNFTFVDGSQHDKLFVVLNNCDLQDPSLLLKTTSQAHRYLGCTKGCNKNRKCFFASKDWQTCFLLDTYIQLPEIFEISTAELLQGKISGNIEILSCLSPDCLSQLKSCLAGFKEDITGRHWGIIYKAR